uniref:Uncharacterized protein n=1 Tax=Anthurium amnicola TaxID=1678845 RepID=A0A1D1Y0Z1_9ARAE
MARPCTARSTSPFITTSSAIPRTSTTDAPPRPLKLIDLRVCRPPPFNLTPPSSTPSSDHTYIYAFLFFFDRLLLILDLPPPPQKNKRNPPSMYTSRQNDLNVEINGFV